MRQLYVLLNVEITRVKVYADSWGVRRLISLALRRWKAPIYNFRDARLHRLMDIMTEAWGPQHEVPPVAQVDPAAAEPSAEPGEPPARDPPAPERPAVPAVSEPPAAAQKLAATSASVAPSEKEALMERRLLIQ